jgi:hypothetical protein
MEARCTHSHPGTSCVSSHKQAQGARVTREVLSELQLTLRYHMERLRHQQPTQNVVPGTQPAAVQQALAACSAVAARLVMAGAS